MWFKTTADTVNIFGRMVSVSSEVIQLGCAVEDVE